MKRSNPFRFKQFTIVQDHAAMKVGTDGVLLGAWCRTSDSKKALDIGAGTGLISLMIAQRSNAEIVAIEIDKDAMLDICFNVEQSPWNGKIIGVNQPIETFAQDCQDTFDTIVCNPPYFTSGISGAKESKRLKARHEDALPFDLLVQCVSKLLSLDGHFSVILPTESKDIFETLCRNHGMYLSRATYVKPTPEKAPKRVLMEYTTQHSIEPIVSDLIIEQSGRHQYSEEYKALTKDFYLAF